MLDRESRFVLDTMRKSQCDKGCGVFTYEYLAGLANLEEDSLRVCAQHLAERGHIKVSYYEPSHVPAGIYLTQTGKHYKEYIWLRRKDFWIKSILVPIVVSVATAFITALVF